MFRFPLESLLRYRRQKEDAEMYELSNRIRSMRATQADLEMIKKRIAHLTIAAQEQISAAVTAPVIALYSAYLHQLRQLGIEAQDKLKQAQAEIERQREKLIKASVDRKIMERFKEIQHQAYNEAEAKKDQKAIDEINTLKAGRKNEES